MFDTIQISAPGKLFLIGEYAVLEGAPALLTAVDRRATVVIKPAAGDRWQLHAPNLQIEHLELNSDGTLPADLTPTMRDHLRVFNAVRAVVAAHLDAHLPPLAIHIDSSDFARGGYKLGLGSSAAVAAALTLALLRAGAPARADQTMDRAQVAALAIEAHRAAQGGTGSGGDVAASVYGGFIQYRPGQPPLPLAAPSTLTGLAVVTGTGASTTELVGRVKAYARAEPERYGADMARLADLAATAHRELAQADAFVVLAGAFFAALTTLDNHAGAGIVSARHRTLHAVAQRHGCVFKSSGAGGGDVGLLFAGPGSELAAVRAAFAAEDAEILDLSFGAPGVRDDRSAPGPA